MTAYNVVRFKVKPGQEQKFIDLHKSLPDLDGMKDGALSRPGTAPIVSWASGTTLKALLRHRPQMIGILDGFRAMLEDLGGGLGLTDPVSGPAVVKFPAHKH